jgi:DNA-binding PucR family transcriptional regulator
VGVGALADGHTELRRAVVEAREARRAGQRRRRPAAVATYDHVGSHRALLAHHDAESLARFTDAVLGAVRGHDAAHGSDLEHTLRAFLAHGGRFNETAAVLHVHVNTLRNRLARIEELSGRDLGVTEDRVDLFLALHADPVE